MSRTSPVYYIAPSAISITPNANNTADDLAVFVAEGAKIRVYSKAFPELGFVNGTYQEWTLSGRNRRLSASDRPYTIYARLPKNNKDNGYLVFAPKDRLGDEWLDKYLYVTMDGYADIEGVHILDGNWWFKIGDVSLPENGKRTVTFDTGILGTDQFNTEWNLDPDDMPLRVDLGCVIDDEDAGPTPYVPWGGSMNLHASLVEGWATDASSRIDHWEITRNSGNTSADNAWNEAHAAAFAGTGDITLSHPRSGADDFAGAVSVIFTVTAWGEDASSDSSDSDSSSSGSEVVMLASASITAMAETIEKYELVRSTDIVSYNPPSDTYTPDNGVDVMIRATDQRGVVARITFGQFLAAGLAVSYKQTDSDTWVALPFTGAAGAMAIANIPTSIFYSQQGLTLRLQNAAGEELHTATIAFVRDGDDSKEREWIFLRSQSAIVFGGPTSEHPLPALISGGEVNPTGAATGLDTDKNQDGWVPEGWWDEPQGTDDTYHYEYGAYRDFVRPSDSSDSSDSGEEGSHWGDFSSPRIWSYYGEDAVSYRCRWTLGGTEVWQLVASYTGAFKGDLPLVATLMRRKGSGVEEPMTASATVITVSSDGLSHTITENVQNPRFVISESVHQDFISDLNNVDLTGLSIDFVIDGETFSYSILVVREADEESVKDTIEEYGSELFLSKVRDDIAEGNMRFKQDVTVDGIQRALAKILSNRIESDNFTGDGELDSGFRLMKNAADGVTGLIVDNLFVRMKAVFSELEIRKISYAGGNIIFSHAGSKIIAVKPIYRRIEAQVVGHKVILSGGVNVSGTSVFMEDGRVEKHTLKIENNEKLYAYRCYIYDDDGTTATENWWKVDDQARCQTFNIKEGAYQNVSNSFYWRRVIAVGSEELEDGKIHDYIDLSISDSYTGESVDGVDISQFEHAPQVGDQIVQMGHRTDPARQGFISIEVYGDNAPGFKVYKGVNSYSLDGKRKICISPSLTEIRAQKFIMETEYDTMRVPNQRTDPWHEGMQCYYYDLVQHNGATWLCTYPESGIDGVLYTTEEPSETATYWRPYAQKGNDGSNGADGYNTATVTLYKRSSTPVTSVGITEACTYNFANKTLTGNLNGWSLTIPTNSTDEIYVTAAVASSRTGTDDIAANEWASPAKQAANGQDGAHGMNTAPVFLYQRAAAAPAKPTGNLTYTFSTGVLSGSLAGWSQTIPATDGNPCWVIQATALATTDTDTIAASEWSSQVKLVEDGADGADGAPGADGADGADGYNTALVPIYQRYTPTEQAVTPALPNVTLYYKFSTGKLYTNSACTAEATAQTMNGWSQTIPATSAGTKLFITQATARATTESDSILPNEWAGAIEYVADGNGIKSVTRTYARSAQSTTASETTAPTIEGSWAATSPAVNETYPYLWAKEVVEYTKAATTTKYYMIGARGDNGVDAQDIEWVYIRTKTATAPVIADDSTYTDHNGKNYTADDHLPHVTGNANIENNQNTYECTDDPKGVDETWKYEWEIKREKGAATGGHRSWVAYSGTMTLHNNFAESALTIDLTNDNDQFGVDADGKVLALQTRSTVVAMLFGSQEQAFTSAPTASLKYDDGTTVDTAVAEASVAVIQNTDNKKYQVTVTVKATGTNTPVFTSTGKSGLYVDITGTCAKGTKTIRFTMEKVMSGAAGVNPIIYQLEPSQKAFSFGRDASNNLTPASRSTQINVAKTEGNTTTILSSTQTGITYKWGWDESSTAQASGQNIGTSITVTNTQAASHNQVWVELSKGDRETLPITKDGAEGDTGPAGISSGSVVVYKRATSIQSSDKPDNNSRYYFKTVGEGTSQIKAGSLVPPSGGSLNGWTLAQPGQDNGKPLWSRQATALALATEDYDEIGSGEWSTAEKVVENGEPGNPGDDAINVSLSSPITIIQQNTSSPYTLNLSNAFTDIIFTKGDEDITSQILSSVTLTPSTYTRSGASYNTCTASRDGKRVSITAVSNYTQDEKTVYVEEGYVTIAFTYNNQSYSLTFVFKCNLLGSWKQEIEGDVETTITEKTTYTVNGQSYTVENDLGTYIRSSELNMARIEQKIINPNLFTGMEDGTGWGDVNTVYAAYPRISFSNSQRVLSPDITLPAGKYTLSWETDDLSQEGEPSCRISVYDSNLNLLYSNYEGGTGRLHTTFTLAAQKTIHVEFELENCSTIYEPKLEKGEYCTDFEQNVKYSEFKQTADGINLIVNDPTTGVAALNIKADGLSATVNDPTTGVAALNVKADGISSTVSQLQKGKNMLSGALIGTGWRSANSGLTPHYLTKDVVDNWIELNSDDTYIVSPSLDIKKDTKYTLAFDVSSLTTGAVTVKIYSSAFQLLHTLTTSTSGRRKVSFTATANNTVMVYFQTQKIHYPQLEMGSVATDFEASTGETVSQIKQTAESINLQVEGIKKGNLFGNNLTNGWQGQSGDTDCIEYTESRFRVHDDSFDMYSPVLILEPDTKYCFSVYGNDPRNNSAYALMDASTAHTYNSDVCNNGTIYDPTWHNDNGRYWFTFTTPNSSKKFVYNMYVSNDQYLEMPQLEIGDEPTDFKASSSETAAAIRITSDNINLRVGTSLDAEGHINQSEIDILQDTIRLSSDNIVLSGSGSLDQAIEARLTVSQVDQEIKMQVGAVGINIDEEKIELNGNTTVNGSLEINGDDNGFSFTGNGGRTNITSDSIGTYDTFKAKASTTTSKTTKGTVNKSGTSVSSTMSTFLGVITSGKTCSLSHVQAYIRKKNSGETPISVSNLSVRFVVRQNNTTLVDQTVSSASTQVSFTTIAYSPVTVSITVSGTANYTPASGSTYLMEEAFTMTTPNDAFMQIGYDGMAVNFSSLKTCFIGSEGAYFRFGNYALRITSGYGVQKTSNAGAANPSWTNI